MSRYDLPEESQIKMAWRVQRSSRGNDAAASAAAPQVARPVALLVVARKLAVPQGSAPVSVGVPAHHQLIAAHCCGRRLLGFRHSQLMSLQARRVSESRLQ